MTSALFPSVDLKHALSGAQLAALPQSAIRLLELSQDANNGPAEFAGAIESDPGLTGQVLRFVNSSYFGFSREISSVKLALALVGIRTIKNFALWSAVFSLMPNPRCGPFDLRILWQDSLRRALFARTLGQLLGLKEAEDLFSAALLQDMAVPLLAKAAPEAYGKLLTARRQSGIRLSALERTAFGWTHATAAALLGHQWNLPEAFVQLLEGHLDIDRYGSDPGCDARQAAVALSALLPTVADPFWDECEAFEGFYAKTGAADRMPVAVLLARIDSEFADFAPVLKLRQPSKTLVESYEEAIAAASQGALATQGQDR